MSNFAATAVPKVKRSRATKSNPRRAPIAVGPWHVYNGDRRFVGEIVRAGEMFRARAAGGARLGDFWSTHAAMLAIFASAKARAPEGT